MMDLTCMQCQLVEHADHLVKPLIPAGHERLSVLSSPAASGPEAVLQL